MTGSKNNCTGYSVFIYITHKQYFQRTFESIKKKKRKKEALLKKMDDIIT